MSALEIIYVLNDSDYVVKTSYVIESLSSLILFLIQVRYVTVRCSITKVLFQTLRFLAVVISAINTKMQELLNLVGAQLSLAVHTSNSIFRKNIT